MKSLIALLTACAIGAAFLTLSMGANAGPCAGFTDVDTASQFCPNVEWLKNRGVTLGCTPTTYCPSDPVSRLQMAAFMNRLGTALTPLVVTVVADSGALDLDLTPVVCESVMQDITNFPRRAMLDATFSGTAAADVDIAMSVVWSADGGVTWLPLSTAQSVTFVPGTRWSAASDLGALDLAVGGTAQFGIQVSRNGAGSTNLSDSRCQLRATIGTRDGTSSPY
jgi:hypothetical protein